MTSHVPTVAPRTAPSTMVKPLLRFAATLLALAGLIKVSQTGAIGFALVLVVPWAVVAVRSRPGPRAALTAVIVGSLEVTLAGSRLAAGDPVEWFDLQMIITAISLGPVAVALGSYLLLRRPQD